MTETPTGDDVQVVPGMSYVRMNMWGAILELAAASLVIPIAFESSYKSIEGYYIGVLATVLFVLLITGGALTMVSYRNEIAR